MKTFGCGLLLVWEWEGFRHKRGGGSVGAEN